MCKRASLASAPNMSTWRAICSGVVWAFFISSIIEIYFDDTGNAETMSSAGQILQTLEPLPEVRTAFAQSGQSDACGGNGAIDCLVVLGDGVLDPVGRWAQPIDVFGGFEIAVQTLRKFTNFFSSIWVLFDQERQVSQQKRLELV